MAQSLDSREHDRGNRFSGGDSSGEYSVLGSLRSVLHVLASLKVTVALFLLAIILVFVGTLAQVDQDIEAIVSKYFRSGLVLIPFQVLFPRSFFPGLQNVPGSIWFPGGWSIGVGLMINLLAAHAIRFKVQARGARLFGGLGVIALGVLTTWVVIASGNNKEGFQNDPLVEWGTLWVCLQYGMGLLWVGMASSLLKIESERKMERWTIIGLTVLLGAALALLFWKGNDAKLNDSSMRILWQLIKGCAAGLVLLAGCVLVFKKRAGVVLLHGGVGLIMFNELLVGLSQVENQMPIVEGETINWVHDVSKAELAIVDHSPKDHDDVVVVPFARLQQAAEGEIVRDDNLPIDFKVLSYFQNSALIDPPADNPASKGVGRNIGAKAADITVGTDSDGKVNLASSYIEFFEKGTKNSLGTYLMSQQLTTIQKVGTAKKQYDVVLRSKRTYKPYSLHLIDVRGDNYLGTSTARNYSSDVRLVDKSRNVDREVKIWMNNPLRYAGETFYQQSFHTFSTSENGRMVVKEQTVLQIVRNAGWMIPYVACMIVATGMLAHFWLIMLRFLNRRAAGVVPIPAEFGGELSTGGATPPGGRQADAKTLAGSKGESDLKFDPLTGEAQPWHATLARYLPLLAALFFGGWLAGKAVPPRTADDAMNIYEFGKVPVVYEGRVKPIDSLARNSLRLLSNYQTFRDEDDEKRTAIQWLLDVIARPEQADKYRVFRIDHPEVLHEMRLPRREGFRYAYKEFEEKIPRLRALSADARNMSPKLRSAFQSEIVELHTKVRRYTALRQTHLFPPKDMSDQRGKIIEILLSVNPRLEQVPLAVPAKVDDTNWQPMTRMATPIWLRRYAAARGLKTPQNLALDLLLAQHSEETILTFRKVLSALDAGRQSRLHPNMSRLEIQRFYDARVAELPQEEVVARVGKTLFARMLTDMNGETFDGKSNENVTALVDIFSAYSEGDATKFNQRVAEYRASLAESEPDQYDASKVAAESWFNHFEPFYYCSVLYIIAFLLAVGGLLGYSRPLNLTALLLIVGAFSVHTLALGMRMYISGRMGVTVTNLYSSAVFIGWACCLLGLIMEVVFRIGVGNIVAGVTGFGTLLIAHFLAIDGDTIAVMQAVLDTNFWLATHVTSITIGYATTFVAWILGVVFVVLGLFTPYLKRDMEKILSRMIYGSLCFAIFFSFVGTVLGGLWADDSWGRFWGWDPKENGALIIVLWNALVLHARWGGIVKDRGLAVLAVGGGIVTAWSWFGVNLLGVGLHAYGFKAGIGLALGLYVLSQMIVFAAGCTPKDLWVSFRQKEADQA